MKFGLSDAEFNLLDSLVIRPLKNLGATVWIFGSRARGDHKPFSDVDILYSPEISMSHLSFIKEAIEESRLPYKIDLVNLSEVAESYRDQILNEKIEV